MLHLLVLKPLREAKLRQADGKQGQNEDEKTHISLENRFNLRKGVRRIITII